MKNVPKREAKGIPSLDRVAFTALLNRWYSENARILPWRNVNDAYATWVSEVMLQQTRVATVVERYTEFMERWPTVESLAAAEEQDVLALWSGLGYYRRARMLHRGARTVTEHLQGKLPRTVDELKQLPGVGDYTAAAIASIAFGERVAVLDGNVQRVLLRVLGKAEDKSSATARTLQALAQSLLPGDSAASAGDHNQAMMELGATVCLPRGPLCLQCPVVSHCRTQGEHPTDKRAVMKRVRLAYLLSVQDSQVLLARRSADQSLMPGMLELPPLPLDCVDGTQPLVTVRHAITDTIYTVDVFTEDRLRKSITAREDALEWSALHALRSLPLTGLARKILQRQGVWPQG